MENRGEIEVNLKDVFFRMLICWRPLLLLGLIAGVLLGAYQYRKNVSQYRSALEEWKILSEGENLEETNKRINDLSVEEKRAVLTAVGNDRQLMTAEYNRDNSPYYLANPYRIRLLEMDLSPESGEVSETIRSSLESLLKRELDNVYEVLISDYGDVYRVHLILLKGEDEKTAEEEAKKVLAGAEASLADSLQVLAVRETTARDMTMSNDQINNKTDIERLTTLVEDQKNKLNADQKMAFLLYDQLLREEIGAEKMVYEEPDAPGFPVKHAVLGFLAGVILGALFILLRLIFSKKVRTAENAGEYLGIRAVSAMHQYGKRSAFRRFLSSRKIYEWRWRKENPERESRRSLELLKLSAASNGENAEHPDSLVLVSFAKPSETEEANLQAFEKLAGENGFSCRRMDFTSDQNSELSEDSILIPVIQYGRTRYEELSKFLPFVTAAKMNVPGYLYLECD